LYSHSLSMIAPYFVLELLRSIPIFTVVIKLSTIAITNRSLATTLFFGEIIDLSLNFRIRQLERIYIAHSLSLFNSNAKLVLIPNLFLVLSMTFWVSSSKSLRSIFCIDEKSGSNVVWSRTVILLLTIVIPQQPQISTISFSLLSMYNSE